jgi:CubicO group peptidase (beta-lactamase class C family)
MHALSFLSGVVMKYIHPRKTGRRFMLGRREFLVGGFLSMTSVELRQGKLDAAAALIEKATVGGEVSAAALHVRRRGLTFERAFGLARDPEAVFLLASITKPMTATGVMILVERGRLSLSDPVCKFIPEFTGGDRNLVTVRHLLTHTSGLPDQLPENVELRKRHAPLSDFVAGACQTPLLFKPGTRVRYQSMGVLLAAEIVQRLTLRPFRDFLRDELFLPLGMTHTSLGLGGRSIPDTMLCQVQGAPSWGAGDTDWNWNSLYWRDLGAPWGGAHSTAGDVVKLLELFQKPDGRILKVQTASAMIENQTRGLNEPWGLGWMLKPREFGRTCSARTFGHYGSTGTVAWCDPSRGLVCVLLTTRPADQSRDGLLGPVSDLVADAVG